MASPSDELAAEQGLEAHVASIQDPADAQLTAGDDLADEILGFLRRRTT